MTPFQTVIFDFDGVIADTEEGRIRILRRVLDEAGHPDVGVKRSDIVGLPTKTFLAQALPEASEEQIEVLVGRRREILLGDVPGYVKLYPGARETVCDLAENHTVVLATVNERHIIDVLLDSLGLADCFSRVFTRDDIYEEGQSLKNYSHVAEQMGLDLHTSVVIEDSCFGVRSAKQCGFYCVCLHDCKQQCSHDPDVHIPDYAQLRTFFHLPPLGA